MKKVCVVGLGYVGLPLAVLLVTKGYDVLGSDIDERKVALVNKGISPIKDDYLEQELPLVKGNLHASLDERLMRDAEAVVVCVPTPIYEENHQPDLRPLISATESIARNARKGQLISIESTIAPGTCRTVVKPILESKGFVCDTDFFLCHCPERIDPGNRKYQLKDLPRVLGATSKDGLEKARAFYSSFIEAGIHPVSTIDAAEAAKIVENTFRDVNIAFVNELARSFAHLGIDVVEVIRAASTKPFGFLPHYPGAGVGGHCIGVDPYYLIEAGEAAGFSYDFLKLARKINNSMPLYTVERAVEGLNDLGLAIRGTTITVLGLAYKGNVDDMRESPALKVIDELKRRGAVLSVYDPYLPAKSTVASIDKALQASCLVLCTNHDEFVQLDAHRFKDAGVKVVIDGRNCLNKQALVDIGIIYKGIGR